MPPDPNTELLSSGDLMPPGMSTDYTMPAQAEPNDRLLTTTELFGAPKPISGPVQDNLFGNVASTVGKVVHAFGQGAASQWGGRPLGISDEDAAKLRALGVFPDYEKNQNTFWQGINESLVRPVAAGIDFALNAIPAAAAGVQEVGQRTAESIQGGPGIETDEHGFPTSIRGAAAMAAGMVGELAGGVTKGYYPELGEYEASLGAVRGGIKATATAALHDQLNTARAAGAIGETEAQFHGVEPPTPEQAQERVEAARAAGIEPIEPTPPPPDLDALARRLDPDTFEVYDRAAAAKHAARLELNDLAGQSRLDRPEVVEATNRLNSLLGIEPDVPARAGAFEERMASMAATAPDALREQLADAYDHWASTMEDDTPEMRAVRDRIQAADEEMQARAVQVSEAYRRAREMAPTLPAAEIPPSAVPANVLTSIPADAQAVAAAEQKAVGAGADKGAKPKGPGKVTGKETLGEKGERLPVEAEVEQQAGAMVQQAVADGRAIASAQALGEHEPPPGTVRLYHGGDVAEDHAGPLPVTRSRVDAEAAAKAAGAKGAVYSMDVTPEELEKAAPSSTGAGTLDLPAELASQRTLVQGAGEPAAATEAAAEAAKPAAGGPVEPGTPLHTAVGTGEEVERGLAVHVNENTVAAELSLGFGDLPTYRRVSMAVQAKAASQLVNADYETAKAIAMGHQAPPIGLLPESVYTAVKNAAMANGDVDTLYALATQSRLLTTATEMGQRIRALADTNVLLSPVSAVQAVQAAREAQLARRLSGEVIKAKPSAAAVAKLDAAKDAAEGEIKDTVRAQASTDKWSDFLSTLACD